MHHPPAPPSPLIPVGFELAFEDMQVPKTVHIAHPYPDAWVLPVGIRMFAHPFRWMVESLTGGSNGGALIAGPIDASAWSPQHPTDVGGLAVHPGGATGRHEYELAYVRVDGWPTFNVACPLSLTVRGWGPSRGPGTFNGFVLCQLPPPDLHTLPLRGPRTLPTDPNAA